ncbi:MAG: hypothetical protein IAE87_17575 [Rhodobacteraceae bacterium]|nr:hypothetical protein [Paracoccaceae bacterium]
MAVQQNGKKSLGSRWESYSPSKTALFWSCVATAALTMILGFGWGGWVTGGSSRAQSDTAANAARVELATTICVDRFGALPDAAARRAELAAITNNSERRQFVETGGWALMPGQTTTDRTIATACATALAV